MFPLSLVEVTEIRYKQVFWLRRHHSPHLPGFPVAFKERSSFTVVGPHRTCTCFPLIIPLTLIPVSEYLLLTYFNIIDT